MGYADEKSSAWYCSLHREAVLGRSPPQLQHYELFEDWVLQIARFYPESQWTFNTNDMWKKLHGEGSGVGMLDDHRQKPGDGDIPTREELQKILSRLKPGLYGKVVREQAEAAMVLPNAKEHTQDDHSTAI